ncbi:hypothetical protein ACGFMM_34190 [Streptomyces sp. NPDC048604]|uniref:hypothetical protein n=1 Tax=Streptomyces sp. NPDC048604 TaxID=3365578 RepID=UPI00370FC35A
MTRWVLEEFGRAAGEFRGRRVLAGLSDDEACALLELGEEPGRLGDGDLFDYRARRSRVCPSASA